MTTLAETKRSPLHITSEHSGSLSPGSHTQPSGLLIPLETEADLISRLSKIESDAEYFFADVDETQGGEWKDLLESKLRFKWHNQFKNFDYFKNKQDSQNPETPSSSAQKKPSNLEL
jgi:hypothetical protein